MSRKTAIITIDEPGRDQGRTYFLREMSASHAERWAARALLGMTKSGIELPTDIAGSGLAGIAAIGLRALGKMSFEDAEVLLNDMFECVQFIPDPSKPHVVRNLIEDDIDEIATRLRLRKEVFGLHVNFSEVAAILNSAMASAPEAAAA